MWVNDKQITYSSASHHTQPEMTLKLYACEMEETISLSSYDLKLPRYTHSTIQ